MSHNADQRCLHRLALAGIVLLGSNSMFAASATLIPDDSNSRITVENAVVDADGTTVFFFTWPDLDDFRSGVDCPLNYYSVRLTPGLPQSRAELVAKGVCGGLFQKSRLLGTGDALIVIQDRMERWRAGQQLAAKTFSSLDAVKGMGITTDQMGSQLFDIVPDGGMVIARYLQDGSGPQFPGATVQVASLGPEGGRRWINGVGQEGDHLTVQGLWAGADGGALLQVETMAASGLLPQSQHRLVLVSPAGMSTSRELTAMDGTDGPSDPGNVSQEDLMRMLQNQGKARPESIRKLSVQPRARGGFEVLFQREGGAEGREGHFLQRLGSDGTLQSEIALGAPITEHGLEDWRHFEVTGNQLILFGKVQASQRGVEARRDTYSQGVVSWVDIPSGSVLSRLLPLDSRYLQAAMNAGDEDIQNLPGLPGGEPALLTELDGVPLAVSLGIIGGRNSLRVTEVTDDLPAWTEAYDRQRARIENEESKRQRTADREARQQQLNASLAASVGMTPEAFAALSSRERKEVMLRQGDAASLQQMAAQQAQAASQAASGQEGQAAGAPADQMSQFAAAMAEAQKEMANNPSITPEMRAQMAEAMAKMQQSSMAPQVTVPAQPAAPAPAVAPGPGALPEDAIVLDANLRGFVEFEHADGQALTLVIFDRQNASELFSKDYPDGTVYEYIDFNRYGLPLSRIGVVFRDAGGNALAEPALVVQQ